MFCIAVSYTYYVHKGISSIGRRIVTFFCFKGVICFDIDRNKRDVKFLAR